ARIRERPLGSLQKRAITVGTPSNTGGGHPERTPVSHPNLLFRQLKYRFWLAIPCPGMWQKGGWAHTPAQIFLSFASQHRINTFQESSGNSSRDLCSLLVSDVLEGSPSPSGSFSTALH